MNIDQKIVARLEELIILGNELIVRLQNSHNLYQLHSTWKVSSQAALRQIFDDKSEYYLAFCDDDRYFNLESAIIPRVGILEAAKNDYEKGYCSSLRSLITAEVFSDLLEQAKHLLDNGYFIPAAVLAGCVLEDALRKLCQTNDVTIANEPKLNYMSDQLQKQGAYNALTHKNVAVWANLRNDAAHGKWNELSNAEALDYRRQVSTMIQEVESFIAKYLTY